MLDIHTRKRVLLSILAVLVLALTALACGETPTPTPEPTDTPKPRDTPEPTDTPAPTNTPPPTPTPKPTSTPAPAPGDVILAESFSGPDSEERWDLREDAGYVFSIEDGELVAVGSDPDSVDWVNSSSTYSDLDLEIEATILEGGTDALFGIVFSVDPSGDTLGWCLIQGDDSALCGEMVDGEAEFGDLASAGLSPSGEANSMRLVVVDRQWALYVNDQCVGSGESDVVGTGGIGFVVSTASESSARIGYDNLIIRVPDDDSLELLACEPTPFTGGGEPEPAGGDEPEPAPAPAPTEESAGSGGTGSGNSIVEVSNYAASVNCRVVVFVEGGDRALDVQSGGTQQMELPPGRYAWGLWLGNKTPASQVIELNLRPGIVCRIACFDDHYSWSGCE